MQKIRELSSIIERYDALLLDLWGVVHDGTHLYPGVRDALVKLREAEKKIIFISNAPRRAARVKMVLSHLSIEPALYFDAISSGESGYQWLAAGGAGWGRRYYYIGPVRDADVLDGLEYTRADDVAACDFLLNVGFGTDEQSNADWLPLLTQAQARGLPMLCLNPDMEVVKITGERYACAGVIGKLYEQLGGEVTWFGKPYAAIYETCFAALGIPKARILGVGDSLETDIRGAQTNQIDSLLITGGILKSRTPDEVDALCREYKVAPNFVMPRLGW